MSVEETSEQVIAVYALALEDEGLLEIAEVRMLQPNSDEQLPVLLSMSDNGLQMIPGTREWVALHSLVWHAVHGVRRFTYGLRLDCVDTTECGEP